MAPAARHARLRGLRRAEAVRRLDDSLHDARDARVVPRCLGATPPRYRARGADAFPHACGVRPGLAPAPRGGAAHRGPPPVCIPGVELMPLPAWDELDLEALLALDAAGAGRWRSRLG